MGHVSSSLPVGWSIQAPGAQSYFPFPHFPSLPGARVSIPSLPLSLPLVPSWSSPPSQPKGTIKISGCHGPGSAPMHVSNPSSLLLRPRSPHRGFVWASSYAPLQTLNTFVLESTQIVHCQKKRKRHKPPRGEHPLCISDRLRLSCQGVNEAPFIRLRALVSWPVSLRRC